MNKTLLVSLLFFVLYAPLFTQADMQGTDDMSQKVEQRISDIKTIEKITAMRSKISSELSRECNYAAQQLKKENDLFNLASYYFDFQNFDAATKTFLRYKKSSDGGGAVGNGSWHRAMGYLALVTGKKD